MDCRNIKQAFIPERYPIPNIDELSKLVQGARKLSKLERKAGYRQIELDTWVRYIMAMISPKGPSVETGDFPVVFHTILLAEDYT